MAWLTLNGLGALGQGDMCESSGTLMDGAFETMNSLPAGSAQRLQVQHQYEQYKQAYLSCLEQEEQAAAQARLRAQIEAQAQARSQAAAQRAAQQAAANAAAQAAQPTASQLAAQRAAQQAAANAAAQAVKTPAVGAVPRSSIAGKAPITETTPQVMVVRQAGATTAAIQGHLQPFSSQLPQLSTGLPQFQFPEVARGGVGWVVPALIGVGALTLVGLLFWGGGSR